MRKLRLTHGLHTLVDDDVYVWASKHRWYAHFAKGKFYATRDTSNGKSALHREILKPGPGQLVDHRDGDSLDNQRHNLRRATPTENAANRGPAAGVQWKGVVYCKKRGAWRATVRNQILGYFDTARAAAEVRDAKAKELYGDFAWLNFSGMSHDEPEPISTLDIAAEMSARRAALPAFALHYALRPGQRIRLFKLDDAGRETSNPKAGGFYYFRFTLRGRSRRHCLRTTNAAEARAHARIIVAEAKLETERRQKLASKSAEATLERKSACLIQSLGVSHSPSTQACAS